MDSDYPGAPNNQALFDRIETIRKGVPERAWDRLRPDSAEHHTTEPVKLRMVRHDEGTVPVWGVSCTGCGVLMERTHKSMRTARKRASDGKPEFWCKTCHSKRVNPEFGSTLIGRRIGDLTVISLIAGTKDFSCSCACGEMVIRTYSTLHSQSTRNSRSACDGCNRSRRNRRMDQALGRVWRSRGKGAGL